MIFINYYMEFIFSHNSWKTWISGIYLQCSGILLSLEFVEDYFPLNSMEFSFSHNSWKTSISGFLSIHVQYSGILPSIEFMEKIIFH